MKSLALLLLAIPLFAADPVAVPLWSNGAPGSEGKTAKEIAEQPNKDHDYLKVWSIHNPSLTVYLPAAAKATGAAMIIAPGGGHSFLALDIEGDAVARRLAEAGIAGFVLKYRLAREQGSTYKVEVEALADAFRAIRTVRSRAKEWSVNPARIGIMGFSAGGQLAALAATMYEPANPAASDPIDRVSSRPDFQALIYPGGRMDALKITKETPPAFLLCAADDNGPQRNLSTLYPLLKAAGVPVELHIYGSGGHGFGIREPAKPSRVARTWVPRMLDWIDDQGLLK